MSIASSASGNVMASALHIVQEPALGQRSKPENTNSASHMQYVVQGMFALSCARPAVGLVPLQLGAGASVAHRSSSVDLFLQSKSVAQQASGGEPAIVYHCLTGMMSVACRLEDGVVIRCTVAGMSSSLAL